MVALRPTPPDWRDAMLSDDKINEIIDRAALRYLPKAREMGVGDPDYDDACAAAREALWIEREKIEAAGGTCEVI